MVRIAIQRISAKKRLIIAALVLAGLFLVVSTNILSFSALGEAQTGAAMYIHADAPITVRAEQKIEVEVALFDQKGDRLTGRQYANGFGGIFIGADGIKSADGFVPQFSVDTAGFSEVKDEQGNGIGVYKIPVTIEAWPVEAQTDLYSLEVTYVGGGAGSADGATSPAYRIKDVVTFNRDSAASPSRIRYAQAEPDKVTLQVPEPKPNNEPTPPVINTLKYRVKLVSQAPEADRGRTVTGRAEPTYTANWLPPVVTDNAGRAMTSTLGGITEEEVTVRGVQKKTGIYDVTINIETTVDAAGRKAVVSFGYAEDGISFILSSTVNFSNIVEADTAVPNLCFANPYIIEVPHTPTVSDLDFPDLENDSYNITHWTNGAVAVRLEAFVANSDPAINVVAAEAFIDTIGADGTGIAMQPYGGAWNSPYLWVYVDIPILTLQSLAEGSHNIYVHGCESNSSTHPPYWGPVNSTALKLYIDKTAPAVLTTQPFVNEVVSGDSYLILGSTFNTLGGGGCSPIETVQVYEEGQYTWLDAQNDVSRGGTNFSKWFYQSTDQWNTTAIPDGSYTLRVRVKDVAGNTSSEDTVGVVIDNTAPTLSITSPTNNQGFQTGIITITGTATDPHFSSYTVEWGEGTSPTIWNNLGGGASPVTNGTLATWDISSRPDGTYTIRLSGMDTEGNAGSTSVKIYKDNLAPSSEITSPADMSWAKNAVTITGTATDAVSGISEVRVRLQKGAQFWTGSTWGAETWLPATITSGQGTTNAAWQYAWTISGVSHDESVVVTTKAKDVTSNWETPGAGRTIQIDLNGPSVFWSGATPGTWYTTNQTVTVSVSDPDSGPKGFRWGWDTPPTDVPGTMHISGGDSGNTTIPSEGTHTLYVKGYDNVDNKTDDNRQYKLDLTDPGYWTTALPSGWTMDLTPDVTVQAKDIISGLDVLEGSAQFQFSKNGNGGPWGAMVGEPAVFTPDAWQNATVTGSQGTILLQTLTASDVQFNQDSATQNLIRFRIKDVAGRTGTSGNYTIKIDSSAPTSAVTAFPKSPWFNGTVNWAGSDALSGVKWYSIQCKDGAGGVWTPWLTNTALTTSVFSGTYGNTYYFQSAAQDNAGNWESFPGGDGDANATLDNIAPVTSHDLAGTAGEGGWWLSDVTVTLNQVTEALSGWKWIKYKIDGGSWLTYSTPFVVSGNGTHTVQYYGEDNAGNLETTHSVPININNSLPTVPTMNPEPEYTGGTSNTVSWTSVTDPYGGTVTYYVEYDDDPLFGSPNGNSGWTTGLSKQFTGLTNDPATIYYYHVQAKNSAGGISDWSASVYSTQTAGLPIINWGGATPETWYRTNQNVSVWVTDDTSGPLGFRWGTTAPNPTWDSDPGDDINGLSYAGGATGTTTFPSEGIHTLYVWGYNNAGNKASGHNHYWYDGTTPTGWANFTRTYNTQTPNATIQVSDATSGLKVDAGSAQYSYSTDGGVTWNQWVNASITGTNGTTDVQTITASAIPFPSQSDTQNYIKFRISDVAGNGHDTGQESATFQVDNRMPTITSAYPVDPGDAPVKTDTIVKVNFSEKLLSSSLTTTTFKLYNTTDDPGMTTPITGSVTYFEKGDGTVLGFFAPWSLLGFGKQYTAVLTTGIRDLVGNYMAAQYSWSFTTTGIQAALVSPSIGQPITGNAVNIRGTARGDNSFDEYVLEYGAGAEPLSWNDIGTNPRTSAVNDATLGTWDVSALADGVYTIRLRVYDTGTAVLERRETVRVDNTKATAEVTLPTEGSTIVGIYNSTGTALDTPSGVSKVEVQVDGGNWIQATGNNRTEETAPAVTWVPAGAYGPNPIAWSDSVDPSASAGTLKFHFGATANATFSFTGTAVTFISSRAPNRGYARIYIDNIPITDGTIALSGDTGGNKSGIDLYTPDTRYQERVYTKAGLTNGAHTIKVEVVGDMNPLSSGTRVDVDAFEIGGTTNWTYSLNTTSLQEEVPHTIRARATDRSGLVGDPGVTVNFSVDNATPTATIASPLPNDLGGASVTITGTATDTNFKQYDLYYGAGATPSTWNDIGINPRLTPVVNDTLDMWDTTSLGEGGYSVKLVVTDNALQTKSHTIYPIIIDHKAPYAEITSPLNMDYVASTFLITGIALDYSSSGIMSDISNPALPDTNQVHITLTKNVDSFVPVSVDLGAVNTLVWNAAAGRWDWTKTVNKSDYEEYVGEDWGWFGLQAVARDRAQNETSSNNIYACIDETPPPAPMLRGVPDHTRGVISLSWTPVKDPGSGVDYYEVWRDGVKMTSDLQYYDGVAMNTVDATGRFYSSNGLDTSIVAGQTVTHSYKVRAVDYRYETTGSPNNISGWSNTITVKYDSQAPTAPANLTATTAGSTNDIYLEWTPSTDNLSVAEYKIYRTTSPEGVPSADSNNLIATTTTTGVFAMTTFYDANLTPGTTYRYQVVAYDEQQNMSAGSNIASGTAGADPTYTSPHGTFATDSDTCVICHRTHTARGDMLVREQTATEVCYSCHDGTASANATKQEFDYAPSGGHRVKDEKWPNGSLTCVDCHSPHMNPDHASFEDFENDGGVVPDGWTVKTGSWSGQGDSTATALAQPDAGLTHIVKNTGLNVNAEGGKFATKIKFKSASGHAFFTVGGDGLAARSGVTVDLNIGAGTMALMNGSTTIRSETGITLNATDWYRIKIKIGANKQVAVNLYRVVDEFTDTKIAGFTSDVPAGAVKGDGLYIAVGTENASALFDNVRVNDVGMLMSRYRMFHAPDQPATEYKVSEDKLAGEEFCLACHGTASDSPGGSHRQYYTSAHNQLIGQTTTQPQTLTPRWSVLRGKWKEIKQGPLSSLLKGTNNGCLYCHGYHGQQFYMQTAKGEEELCYRCHGRDSNYSRTGANVYQQYQKPYKHGLTLREATIKCTSCHGQRGISDRFSWEGYATSMIVNPFNIKQSWSEMRMGGATIDDYCNACHQENLPRETHTSTRIVPYTIKYPAMYTTPSANGFVRKGYSEKNASGEYIVGHKLWTVSGSCAPGNCHDDIKNQFPDLTQEQFNSIPEFNNRIACTTCHHQHSSYYPRMVRLPEDSKSGGTVNEGMCLHCHNGSVTE